MRKVQTWVKIILGCLLNSMVFASFNATIPVIDMNDYYSNNRSAFIQGLAQAMRTVGFVAVINSNVEKQILDDAYTAAQQFYNQPLAYKMQFHNPELNGQRGYVQSETAKGRNKKDFKEFYHLAPEYPQEISKRYNYPHNIWPNDPAFVTAMQKLIAELNKYSAIIGEALALGLKQDKDFFSSRTKHGMSLLRSIHYPADPPQDTVWAAAHTDIDLFTILPRATSAGLQVQNQQGEWIDVVVPDNAFIINAGDMLQNITNGVYKSAAHRVVAANQSAERYSMVMFILPRPHDLVGPLPEFIKQVGKQRFAHVTSQELLFERLIDLGLHNQTLLESFANSGAMEKLIAVNRGSITAMQALKNANLASPMVLKALQQVG